MRSLLLISLIALALSCSSTDDALIDQVTNESLYFPPLTGNQWETINPEELNWDSNTINELETFLIESNTEAFIILKDGKIAMEPIIMMQKLVRSFLGILPEKR